MGLDFIIQRKRKGETYESDAWEEVVYGRNCHNVKKIVLENISTYDRDKFEAKLSIGTLNNLVGKLAEYTSSRNLNDDYIFEDDDYTKTLDFLSQLAKAIHDHCIDKEYDDIEYEYRLIDSY